MKWILQAKSGVRRKKFFFFSISVVIVDVEALYIYDQNRLKSASQYLHVSACVWISFILCHRLFNRWSLSVLTIYPRPNLYFIQSHKIHLEDYLSLKDEKRVDINLIPLMRTFINNQAKVIFSIHVNIIPCFCRQFFYICISDHQLRKFYCNNWISEKKIVIQISCSDQAFQKYSYRYCSRILITKKWFNFLSEKLFN